MKKLELKTSFLINIWNEWQSLGENHVSMFEWNNSRSWKCIIALKSYKFLQIQRNYGYVHLPGKLSLKKYFLLQGIPMYYLIYIFYIKEYIFDPQPPLTLHVVVSNIDLLIIILLLLFRPTTWSEIMILALGLN